MKRLGLDTETGKAYWEKGSLRTIQIYSPAQHRVLVMFRPKGEVTFQVSYVWIDKKDFDGEPLVERTKNVLTQQRVTQFMADPQNGFVTQNGYFEHHVLLRDLGVEPNIVGDSYIYGIIIPSGVQASKSLNSLMQRYVDDSYEKNKWGSWEEHDWDSPTLTDNALRYCAFDAYASYAIEETLLKDYPRYNGEIYKLELALLPILARMKHRGIKVREKQFEVAIKDYSKKVDELQATLDSEAGWHVRVGSNADLGQFLFEQRKNSPVVYTKGGKTGIKKPSTSKDALAYINDPIVETVVSLKENQSVLSNLESVWASPQIEVVEEEGERYRMFHPTFKPLSESQGSRIYTENPSINQWTWPLKECIYPTEKGVFWFGDVSAFELMVLAYEAGQEDLVAMYKLGEDPHIVEAKKIFGDKVEITDSQREDTKTVEYAAIFGSEGASVARKLRCSIESAMQLCRKFMETNNKINLLRERIYADVVKTGIAKTAFGRFRRIPLVYHSDQSVVDKGKRQAFNFRAQSGAGDIMKMAIVQLDAILPPEYQITFPVFDSVIVRLPDASHKDKMDEYFASTMRVKVPGAIWPFRFKSGVGPNWLAAKMAAKEPEVSKENAKNLYAAS